MSDWKFLNRHRVRHGQFSSTDNMGCNGAFQFAIPGEARKVCVICSDGMGWKHVSVSFGNCMSTPSWEVMCAVKDLFFEPEDVVVQFHPAKSAYKNDRPGCLHLWMVTDGRVFPTPARIMV